MHGQVDRTARERLLQLFDKDPFARQRRQRDVGLPVRLGRDGDDLAAQAGMARFKRLRDQPRLRKRQPACPRPQPNRRHADPLPAIP